MPRMVRGIQPADGYAADRRLRMANLGVSLDLPAATIAEQQQPMIDAKTRTTVRNRERKGREQYPEEGGQLTQAELLVSW